MMKDYSTIEAEASRLNRTFFLSEDDARKAVKDLETESPELFKVKDLKILEVYPDGSDEPRYMPKFDYEKTERKIVIRKDPSLFGDTFPPFRKSESNIFRLYSIGLGNENIRKDISKSFSKAEDFLEELYDGDPTDPDMNAKELTESFTQKYFESLSRNERADLYKKFIENDETKRSIYLETAEKDLDESLGFLWEGARDYSVKEILEYMFDILNRDMEDDHSWKTDWLQDAVEENKKYDLEEFSNSSDSEQVNVLMDNCVDNFEVHNYVYQFLLECVSEKYVLLSIDVYQSTDDWGNPEDTWLDYDASKTPNYEDLWETFENQIVVARKDDIARKYFGVKEWDEDLHEEKAQNILDELLENYASFLNREICEAQVYQNGKIEYVEYYYGRPKDALELLRKDLENLQEFQDFFENAVFEGKNGEIKLQEL